MTTWNHGHVNDPIFISFLFSFCNCLFNLNNLFNKEFIAAIKVHSIPALLLSKFMSDTKGSIHSQATRRKKTHLIGEQFHFHFILFLQT